MEDKKKVICNECESEVTIETRKEVSYCPICGSDDIYVIYEREEQEDH